MKDKFDKRRFSFDETVQVRQKTRSTLTSLKYKRNVTHPTLNDRVGLITIDINYGDIYPWAIGTIEKTKGTLRMIKIEYINETRGHRSELKVGSTYTASRDCVVSYKEPCAHHSKEYQSELNQQLAKDLVNEGHLCVQLQESFPVCTVWCNNREKCLKSQ